MAATYGFRIDPGPFDAFRRTIEAFVATSAEAQKSWNDFINSSPQLATAMSRAEDAVKRVVEAQRGLGKFAVNDNGAMDDAVRRADALAQATERAAQAQAKVNQFAGVQGPAGAEDYARRQAELEAWGRTVDALRAKYVPLEAEQQRYRAGLEEIARAEAAGALTAQEAAQARVRAARLLEQAQGTSSAGALARANEAAKKASEANQGFAVSNDSATASAGKLRQVLGQAGYQIQDFAVQVQGGTSALTALAQQGPQLLSIFGPGGVVAGAVLAVGALVAGLLGLGKESKEAAEQQRLFNEAMEQTPRAAFTAAMDGAKASIRSYTEAVETAYQQTVRLARESRQTALEGLDRQSGALTVEIMAAEQRRAALLRPVARLGATLQRQAGEDDGTLQPEDRQQLLARYEKARTNLEAESRRILEMQAQREEISSRSIPLRQLLWAPMGVQGLNNRDLTPPVKEDKPEGGAPRAAREPVDPEIAESYRILTKSLDEVDRAADKSYAAFIQLRDSLDPVAAATARFKDAQATLNDALSQGVIGQADFSKYVDLARQAMDKSIAKAGEVAVSGREIATVFTSAFDGMITGSGKASDAIKRLELGIARMIERAAITGPLEKALGGLDFGSLVRSGFNYLTGSSASGLNYSPVNFNYGSTGYAMANGGVMTEMGPLPLRRYASGGVASRPQVAIYGEGSMPEAFVPLPDGRRIPVAMQGGQGPTINIDARGAEAGVEQRIDAVLARRLPAILAASESSLAAKVNRGGSAAKLFGRRS